LILQRPADLDLFYFTIGSGISTRV
jgi:hypothetical protein